MKPVRCRECVSFAERVIELADGDAAMGDIMVAVPTEPGYVLHELPILRLKALLARIAGLSSATFQSNTFLTPSAQAENSGQSSRGAPSSAQMIGMGYGRATSVTTSQRPTRVSGSTSSSRGNKPARPAVDPFDS